MSKIIQITKLAIRLDTGTVKELPYEYVYDFHGGNFAGVGKDGLEGAINSKGEEFVPVKYPKGLLTFLFNYDNIIEVIGDLAIIQKNKYGVVDLSKREEILPPEFEGKEILKEIDKLLT
ncbi:MAG: hypothetical protein ACI4VH_03930 [Clostridia bacterium]